MREFCGIFPTRVVGCATENARPVPQGLNFPGWAQGGESECRGTSGRPGEAGRGRAWGDTPRKPQGPGVWLDVAGGSQAWLSTGGSREEQPPAGVTQFQQRVSPWPV